MNIDITWHGTHAVNMDSFTCVQTQKYTNPVFIVSLMKEQNACKMGWCVEGYQVPAERSADLYMNMGSLEGMALVVSTCQLVLMSPLPLMVYCAATSI